MLLALKLLVENSGRATTPGSKETLQKSLLSEALVEFLVSCSGPARGAGYGDEGEEMVPVWPEAVSMLQMREATDAMLRVMLNEEQYGDPHRPLVLERSALGSSVGPLLYCLPKLRVDGALKGRILTRIGQLLEGRSPTQAALPPEPAYQDGAHDSWAELEQLDLSGATDAQRKGRFQQHVTFLRQGGLELVLHHLSVQLAEYQESVNQPGVTAAPSSGDAKEEGAEDDLGGLPSNVQEQNLLLPKVLDWVHTEEQRLEVQMIAGDDCTLDLPENDTLNALGLASLYTERLHAFEEAQGPAHGTSAGAVGEVQSSTNNGGDPDSEASFRQARAVATIACAFRVMVACARYGSAETTGQFFERIRQPAYRREALILAAGVGAFGARRTSVAALAFVQFWDELLRMDVEVKDGEMAPATLLPLLEMLALLVPRLLAPLATKLQEQLMLYRNANGCLTPITLAAICSRRPSDVRDMERLLVLARHCASLYAAMLQAMT